VGLLDLPDDDPSSDNSEDQKGRSSLHFRFHRVAALSGI
jgi:hypothetical protein